MTTTLIQVRFNDIDMGGHAHNAVYLSWFEQARMDMHRSFIEADHDWKKQGLILARNEVDYRKPVHLRDSVEVDCWCEHIGTKSYTLRYTVHVLTESSRTLHAEGLSIMVCYDYVRNGTVDVPAAWREALARSMKGPTQTP